MALNVSAVVLSVGVLLFFSLGGRSCEASGEGPPPCDPSAPLSDTFTGGRSERQESCSSSTSNAPSGMTVTVTVVNYLRHRDPETYHVGGVLSGWVLRGVLTQLQETQPGFRFTVKDDVHYGWWLDSVNGASGDTTNGTYWALWGDATGEMTLLPVGVGCYQPQPDEQILLKFTKY